MIGFKRFQDCLKALNSGYLWYKFRVIWPDELCKIVFQSLCYITFKYIYAPRKSLIILSTLYTDYELIDNTIIYIEQILNMSINPLYQNTLKKTLKKF